MPLSWNGLLPGLTTGAAALSADSTRMSVSGNRSASFSVCCLIPEPFPVVSLVQVLEYAVKKALDVFWCSK